MYVPPFVCGIFATITVEILLMITAIIISKWRNKKKRR